MPGDLTVGNTMTWAAVAVAAVALLRTLLLDRSAFVQQKAEIATLRADIDTLKAEINQLKIDHNEQRTLKHQAINQLTKAQLLLKIVQDLYLKCSCEALAPIGDVLESAMEGSGGSLLGRLTDGEVI